MKHYRRRAVNQEDKKPFHERHPDFPLYLATSPLVLLLIKAIFGIA